MSSFVRKKLLYHLSIALLLSLLAAVSVEMVLNYLHRSLLPVTNPYLKHVIHIAICFAGTGACVLAWHLFPSVRNAYAAINYHLLDKETRWKAVDYAYAILAMAMLLHHIYVTLYYPVVAAGAQKLTSVWLPLAAVSFLLGKLWKDKGALILSAFLLLIFERVYIFDSSLPGNTVIILSSAIYSFFICYAVFHVLRPSFRKPFLKVFCAVSTLCVLAFSAICIYTAKTEEYVSNLVGTSSFFYFIRVGVFYGLNVSGGIAACGVMIALLGSFISDNRLVKKLYLLACLPVILANSLTETRTTMIGISFALAAGVCLLVHRLKSFQQKKRFTRIILLGLVFLLFFLPLLAGQLYLNKGFFRLLNNRVLVFRVWAEEAEEAAPTPDPAVPEEAPLEEEPLPPGATPTADPNITYFNRDLENISSANELLSGRLDVWRQSLANLARNPLHLLFGRSVANPGGEDQDFHHAHCIYIQTLLEDGVLGLLLFLGMVALFLVYALRLWKRNDLPSWQQFLPVPAAALLVVELAECLTHFSGGHVPMTVLYFFMGCTVAVGKGLAPCRQGESNEEPGVAPEKSSRPLPYSKEQLSLFIQKAFVVVLSCWIAAYAFLFNRRQSLPVAVGSALLFFIVPCFLGFRFLGGKPLVKPRNRKYCWAGLVLVALGWVLLGLNNSSVMIWRESLEGVIASPLWGHARIIRGDEWAVWTPMVFSQASLGWPGVNTAISAGNIDPVLISVGGIPAWTLAAVFKPFYWGFLLLGTTAGYSLMTLLRFTGLFAVSYGCALYYTKRSRPLSLAATCLLTLSPYVQWWFSQSICEILLFSQAMVLCWIRVLNAESAPRRLAFGALGAWCFGCFLLVSYPAWQVPVGYLVLAVIIWLTIRNRKTLKVSRILPGLAPLAVVAVLLFFIVRNSWPTLMRVKDSAYPGQRLYTGGDRPRQLFTGFLSLFFPILAPTVSNTSELANFLSFAPAGIVLTVWQYWKTKEKDPLSIILLAMIAVFGILALVPLPAWMAKWTLLAQCVRPGMAIGLCDLLLLLRALARAEKWQKRKASLALALGCSVCSVGLAWWQLKPQVYWVPVLLVVAFGVFWLLFSGACKKLTAVTLCLLSVVAGCFVNPVQKGFDVVDNLSVVSFVKEANLDPDSTVIAMEDDYPNTNALLFTGFKCFNSTQPYADPEKWAPVDPEKKWLDIYNRLAHVSLKISEETGFDLYNGDRIIARLTLKDLQTLGVNTLLTQNNYPELRLLHENKDWKLFSLN